MGSWIEKGGLGGDTAIGGFVVCIVGEGEYWGRGSVLSLRASPPQARRGKAFLKSDMDPRLTFDRV